MNRLARALPALGLLALLLVAWQLYASSHQYVVPSLGDIVTQLSAHPGEYVDAAGTTLRECWVGLTGSFIVAFALAVAMAHIDVVERAVMPLAVVLNVTPVVSFAPGLAIAIGFYSNIPRYLVTAIIVFFPILVNCLVGLRSADAETLQYFASLDASRWEILVHLRLPASMPFVFAAARISFPLSVIGAVVAEWSTSGTNKGLGSLIATGEQSGLNAQVWASVLCLALLGLAFTGIVTLAERRALAWQPARRAQA